MSYMWLAVAAAAAIGLCIANLPKAEQPISSHIVPSVDAFNKPKVLGRSEIDKAITFAGAASAAGAFAGTATFPALAASAGLPSGITSAGGYPSKWTATYQGAALVVCLPGMSNVGLDIVKSNVGGLTALNNGC